MKPLNNWILLLLFAALATIAWPPAPTAPLLLIAWIPLLLLHQQLLEAGVGKWKHLGMIYLAHLLWNLGTTWWVWNASPGGSVAAFIANSALMSAPWMLWRWLERIRPNALNPFWFITAWISFEFFHLNWEGTWPWLTIGNGLASMPVLAQWYEYTGALGGTAWILLCNLLLAKWVRSLSSGYHWKQLLRISPMIVLPIALSWGMLYSTALTEVLNNPKINRNEAIIVQPNIDPYGGKFEGMSPELQVQKHLDLAIPQIKPETRLLIFPETALVGNRLEETLEDAPTVRILREFQKQYPHISILTGAETIKFYRPGIDTISPTARNRGEFYVDFFNTALLLNKGEPIQIYHKSKLVPGVERMPYASTLKFLESLSIDMGGTSGSLGVEKESKNLVDSDLVIAPIICYESVFGEYVSTYVKKGANMLAIITNDGWWDNTPGHRQHLAYARLRAIETRRHILRSANTGISGIIHPTGNITDALGWWQEGAIPATIETSNTITIYTRFGDWLGWLALITCLSGLIYILIFYRSRTQKDHS